MRRVVLVLVLLAGLGAGSYYFFGHRSEPLQTVLRPREGLRWSFAYDSQGRITEVRAPEGATKLKYEGNKILKEMPGGETASFENDALGRRIAATNSTGTVQHTYDEFGRLRTVQRPGLPTLTYGYDTQDRVTSQDLGLGRTIAYHYDFMGRIDEIGTPAGKITYTFDEADNKMTRLLPNGIQSTWQYGPGGRLQSIIHSRSNGEAVAAFAYSYGVDGLVAQVNESSPDGAKTVSYGYDALGRMTSVDDSRFGKTEYRYDAAGNRVEVKAAGSQAVASEFDFAGRITKFGGQPARSDAGGNLTSWHSPSGEMSYTFNGSNLLSSASPRGVRLEYDADGALVSRSVDGAKTTFLAQPSRRLWQPLVAADQAGNQTYYVWQGSMPLASAGPDGVHFYLQDQLGSVRAVADGAGAIAKRIDYDGFGLPREGFQRNALEPGYAGEFYDAAASLYVTRARSWSPQLGRFLQPEPDPAAMPAGGGATADLNFNRYAYAANDPVNLVDLSGLSPTSQGWQYYNTQFSQTWWDQWAAEQVVKDHDGIIGNGAVVIAAIEDTFLQHYIAPLEEDVAKLGDLRYADSHPFLYYGTAFKTITDILNIADPLSVNFPLHKADSTLTISLAESTPLRERFYIAENEQLLLPKDAKVLTSQSLRFSVDDPHDLDELHKNVKDLDAQLRKDFDHGNSSHTPLNPGPVGGIYLSGAGEALKNLGMICGFAFDRETGRFVLISDDAGSVGLPPLRMDDVVTVFRSVYEHGEAPWVTIDPNPQDPRGPVMIVRHGDATSDTHVGWVLFESDRVMKVYSLGKDNLTNRDFHSAVAGYKDILDLGFDLPSQRAGNDPVWERFWIVPAEVTNRRTKAHDLTLLDVPLKVNTERMVLRNGKLETAKGQAPSPQAEAFRKWFTEHYADIAKEARSVPPGASGPGTGSKAEAAAFFEDLQRIALISAVAEAMQKSGVPLPAWMREYQVTPTPFSHTTPAITSERTRGNATRSIYGGVGLSPDDRVVRFIDGDAAAEQLAPALWSKVNAAAPLTPVALEQVGRKYHAVALPGTDTTDVGGQTVQENDALVPIGPSGEIRLTRSYNSFFRTNDIFGPGWTLDLPRLDTQRRPVRHIGDSTQFEIGYQLSSPLNTWSVVFGGIQAVPGVGTLMTPRSPCDVLGLANSHVPGAKQNVIFRDGSEMHFDDAGRIVAWNRGPLSLRYEWDATGRLNAIRGLWNNREEGSIALHYNAKGLVETAQSSTGKVATYRYDDAGTLFWVKASPVREYRYGSGKLVEMLREGKPVRQFEYDGQGRLTKEKDDGVERTWAAQRSPDGSVTIASGGDTAQYDSAMRPVSQKLPDGTSVQWRTQPDGSRIAEISLADGGRLVASRSASGNQETWRLPDGGSYRTEFDDAGRPVAVWAGDRMASKREFDRSGRLLAMETESVAMHAEYGPGGILAAVLTSQPGRNDRWVRTLYDAAGRIQAVQDYSGGQTKLSWDASGMPSEISTKNGVTRIRRDDQGHVVEMDTASGDVIRNTWENGQIRGTDMTRSGQTTHVDYVNGKPSRIQRVNGGTTDFVYDDLGRVREVRSGSGAALGYAYDAAGRVKSIEGSGSRFEYEYDAQGRVVSVTQIRR
jgi:RHS repeat-associated protein